MNKKYNVLYHVTRNEKEHLEGIAVLHLHIGITS